MKLRVIADPHIGDKSDTDDFIGEEVFLEFLNDTDRNGFQLVILGDICERWQSLFYWIFKKYKRVWDKLASMYPTPLFILGNHDSDRKGKHTGHILKKKYGLDSSYELIYHGILFIHGHQFDRYNRQGAVIGWLTAKVGGFIESHIYPDIDKDFIKFRRYIQPKKSIVNYPREVAMYAKRKGVKTAVFGHTHEKCAKKYFGNMDVLNPGCLVNGHFDYLEFQNEKREQKEWKK